MNKEIKIGDEILTFYNYKEPLKEIPKSVGYGFFGALLGTPNGEKVQCHICGNLYECLQLHVYQTHGMKAKEYKNKFQLAMKTSLLSETEREKRKKAHIEIFAKLSPQERRAILRKTKKAYFEWRKTYKGDGKFKISLETKNKRGSCPDQILQKIKDCAEVLGHSPSKKDFIHWCGTQRYMHLVYSTFGSWDNAKRAINLSGLSGGNSKNNKRNKYSDEELLEYLQMFYKETGKIPTETDFKRGLLPNANIYRYHFGSVPKARELAGIYDIPSRWNTLKTSLV